MGDMASMIIILAIVFTNMGLMLLLPDPGAYLPSVKKVSDNITLVDVGDANQVVNDSVMNSMNGFSAFFGKTYHEKTYQVTRPRLNETSMDPDLC